MGSIILEIQKFGKVLNSRPAGQEALLRAKQIINGSIENEIILDLNSVEVMTPSFADEFINGLKKSYDDKEIKLKGFENNLLISETLKALNFL